MLQLLNKKNWLVVLGGILLSVFLSAARAEQTLATIDRIQLVTQQIEMLKNRYIQAAAELDGLQKQHDDQVSQLALEKASKNLLDKASLDISVSKSNLDSINIELADARQTIAWLEKNSQEIENQLNVLNIFSLKIPRNEMGNINELRADLDYQQKLLDLEEKRIDYLQRLQVTASTILQFKKDKYTHLNALLKSRRLLSIKQQQVKDELAFQEQQNYWLQQVDKLYAKIAKIDPAKNKADYAQTERDIFYSNENANFAYIESLVVRYKDQIQQLKMSVSKSNSISLLNEIGDQLQSLSKQITRLDAVLNARTAVLDKHILYFTQKKHEIDAIRIYVDRLSELKRRYQGLDVALLQLDKKLVELRQMLDQSLQVELSSRQGFPTFGFKMLLDIGKEILLVPALTFQVMKSLSSHLVKGVGGVSMLSWMVFAIIQVFTLFLTVFMHSVLSRFLAKPTEWRAKLDSRWLTLTWFNRHFIDMVLIGNLTWMLYFFGVPLQNYLFIVYLSLVWLIFKSIMTVARVCLVETTHDTSGHDTRLYYRLKWIILAGALITAVTVFIHQLPLIYELKILCDRLFLLVLLIVSILLLRSWRVVPNLILSHMEGRHPYIQNSVWLLAVIVPILMFGNSIIGLFGYVNLVMTVSWYEGLFLMVMIGYLMMRGLLIEGMQQLSRLVIQYVSNGWLWTEAFLKPIDNILRITLFLAAWTVLFILYGWDKQSPIVERLTRLMHYQLAHVLNTTITPINIIELVVVMSFFYWSAKWTREFVYRILSTRTKDMGIRNSIAVLSQYFVVAVGAFLCLQVLGIDLRVLAMVASVFAFGVGLGLRDLANNFACGFLILLERPLRVGDIVSINGIEGEVISLGSRAVTVRTWDHMELVVPNAEIFNKSFTNWTAKDNIVRTQVHIKISRYDNPHEVRVIIQQVLAAHKDVLKDPMPEVFLKEMSDTLMEFELRYFVNIRQVKSRISVMSAVLMDVWDAFAKHGIKPPHRQQEIVLRSDMPSIDLPANLVVQSEGAAQ